MAECAHRSGVSGCRVAACLFAVACLVVPSQPLPAQEFWEQRVQEGARLQQLGQIDSAEVAFSNALKEAERFGPGDVRVAVCLNALAHLNHSRRNFVAAEDFYRRALAILEETAGPENAATGKVLSSLADLFQSQNFIAEAIRWNLRWVESTELRVGKDGPELIEPLNRFSLLYYMNGDGVEAGKVQQRSIDIAMKRYGPNHAALADSLSNLGVIRTSIEQYVAAHGLFERAVAIRTGLEEAAAENSEARKLLARDLAYLAKSHTQAMQFAEAERLFQQAAEIGRRRNPAGDEELAEVLGMLAEALREQSAFESSEKLMNQSLAIWERTPGRHEIETATAQYRLGSLYVAQERFEKAAALLEKAEAVMRDRLPPGNLLRRTVEEARKGLPQRTSHLEPSRENSAEPAPR